MSDTLRREADGTVTVLRFASIWSPILSREPDGSLRVDREVNMAPRKFRWSVDGGATWTYDEQELPFNLSSVTRYDTVIVEPIGDGVISEGEALPLVRLVPSTADRFYVIYRTGSVSGKVVRFVRNVMLSGTNDLGGQQPEFRPTGSGTIASIFNNPATQTTWQMNETGACETVGRTPAALTMGSVHGLGTGGTLHFETIKVDGNVADHTVETLGSTFELRNKTTATDGTAYLMRELSHVFDGDGNLVMTLHDMDSAGLALIYWGMPMSTGTAVSELWAKFGDEWNIIPLGSADATAYLADAAAVRMRDPATGFYVGASGVLPTLAGFVRCRTEKQPENARTKTYLGQFSTHTGLIGTSVVLEWGTDTPGANSPAASQLADASWVTDWTTHAQTGGTISKSGADLTMTWGSGTSNLRISAPIVGCAVGKRYIASLDFVSEAATGEKEFYIGSNSTGSNSSPPPRCRQSAVLALSFLAGTSSSLRQLRTIRNSASRCAERSLAQDPACSATRQSTSWRRDLSHIVQCMCRRDAENHPRLVCRRRLKPSRVEAEEETFAPLQFGE